MRHKNSIKKKGGATPKSASAKQEASEDSSPGHHLRSLSVKELNPIGFPSKVSPITPHDTKFMMPSDLSSSQNQLNHHQTSLSHSQSSPVYKMGYSQTLPKKIDGISLISDNFQMSQTSGGGNGRV